MTQQANKKYSSLRPLRGAARFRIERELADTLQGRIYAGTDLITQKQVVIKEAWRQLVHSGRSRKGHRVPENFEKERQLIMTLTNLPDCTPGIVKGIDQWDDEHCYYYAMEYCQGELFDYISKTHTRTEYRQFVEAEANKEQVPMRKPNQWVKNVAKMFKQICVAVQFLHQNGYCHLDLSLENTMLSDIENLKVKVIDFGLMQKFNGNDFSFHGRVGKLQYMCPEAYARQVYDARAADVYCLGVMLFMMLIGAPPYQAPQPQNAAFNYFVSGRIGDVLKHWKRLRLITVDALDLLNKILRYQNTRITLDEILKHSFFDGIDDPINNQQANVNSVEQKNDSQRMSLLSSPKSVDQISQDISNMSLEDDQPSNDTKNTPNDNPVNMQISDDGEEDFDVASYQENKENEDQNLKANKPINNETNTYCELLLQEWGLEKVSDALHATGCQDPNQWHLLVTKVSDLTAVGLTKEDAILFIKKYHETFGAPEKKQNAQQTSHNTHQSQQQPALKPQIQQQMSMSPGPSQQQQPVQQQFNNNPYAQQQAQQQQQYYYNQQQQQQQQFHNNPQYQAPYAQPHQFNNTQFQPQPQQQPYDPHQQYTQYDPNNPYNFNDQNRSNQYKSSQH